ncbi:hypothetical protein BBK14_11345 [Parafrankia soli]|uniref:Uncharacterized protein n=1 Tax=Parafrankia soli TaxID=2599596 RepID=A0A1S1R902_9ACTN|nr:hypothetical protein [Parafrankia soli]OHV42209.1 hypothetical protein BBK14_11345 [Parafrankia soli]
MPDRYPAGEPGGCYVCNGSGVLSGLGREDVPCTCQPAAPTLADLPGAAPERSWTGGLTVDQYMSWQRDDDYDGPEPSWLEPALAEDAEEAERRA